MWETCGDRNGNAASAERRQPTRQTSSPGFQAERRKSGLYRSYQEHMNLANRFAQDLADSGLEFTGHTLVPDWNEPESVTFIPRQQEHAVLGGDCLCDVCREEYYERVEALWDEYDPDLEWTDLRLTPVTFGQLEAQYWRDAN